MSQPGDSIATTLGRNVRQLRRSRGWSQAELAERLDVSVDFVGLLERGGRLPSLPTLVALADVFGVTLDGVVGRNPVEDWTETAAAILGSVSNEQRKVVMAMLDGLLNLKPARKRPRPRR